MVSDGELFPKRSMEATKVGRRPLRIFVCSLLFPCSVYGLPRIFAVKTECIGCYRAKYHGVSFSILPSVFHPRNPNHSITLAGADMHFRAK